MQGKPKYRLLVVVVDEVDELQRRPWKLVRRRWRR
jgi:hypothetical protein